MAASSLFSVTDPDGDAITHYQLWDNTAGNGLFRKNGVAQPATFQVTAQELAQVEFVTTATGTDELLVRAMDGLAWTEWYSFSAINRPNFQPVADANSQSPGRAYAAVAASSLFTSRDSDGDAITRVSFHDATNGNGSFRLAVLSNPHSKRSRSMRPSCGPAVRLRRARRERSPVGPCTRRGDVECVGRLHGNR